MTIQRKLIGCATFTVFLALFAVALASSSQTNPAGVWLGRITTEASANSSQQNQSSIHLDLAVTKESHLDVRNGAGIRLIVGHLDPTPSSVGGYLNSLNWIHYK